MLRDDDGLRINRFHTVTEGFPEFVIEFGAVSQVRCHVQAPAVDAVGRRKPFFGDFIDLFAQFG